MPHFEITVTAFATYLVKADTQAEAEEAVRCSLSTGDLTDDEWEISDALTDDNYIESSKRHADHFIDWTEDAA